VAATTDAVTEMNYSLYAHFAILKYFGH